MKNGPKQRVGVPHHLSKTGDVATVEAVQPSIALDAEVLGVCGVQAVVPAPDQGKNRTALSDGSQFASGHTAERVVHSENTTRKAVRSSIAKGIQPCLPLVSRSVAGRSMRCWSVLCASAMALYMTISAVHGQQMPAPTEIRQSRPDAPGTAVTQAMRLMGQGQHAEALAALDVALKSQPRDPRLRFAYALVLGDQGRAVEAIDVLTQLTQDFPELPEPYNNLATLHAQRGDLDKARLALENAIRALPGYSLAHENLGDVYLRLAARSYEHSQAADRNNAAAQTKLGLARDLILRANTVPGK